MGKMGDTWKGVETNTKTGETDQGVTTLAQTVHHYTQSMILFSFCSESSSAIGAILRKAAETPAVLFRLCSDLPIIDRENLTTHCEERPVCLSPEYEEERDSYRQRYRVKGRER